MRKISIILNLFIIINVSLIAQTKDSLINTSDICIRDPFIYTDTKTGVYYMYAQMDNRPVETGGKPRQKGVEVYTSKDLKKWSIAKPVLILPDNCWGKAAVWAPEMHEYRNKFYLFVTLTSHQQIEGIENPKDAKDWPPFYKRGTQVFYADNPAGPFQAFANKAHTPENMMALDGTLWVEDDTPYMIFCNEWVQTVDGRMDIIRLKKDLSEPDSEPAILFRASEAKWVTEIKRKVTDGPFIFKTKKNKLLMIWSSIGKGGYLQGQSISETGKINGPWKQTNKLLFMKNGGHGMIFKTLNGTLVLALHQPNNPSGKERLKLFKVKDKGDYLKICKGLF